MGDDEKPHIIIIPPPFQGHINPSIQLTLNLASKGFTITFINTHFAHDQIKKARVRVDPQDAGIFARAHELGLDVRYTTVNDGFPLSFDRSSNREQFLEGRLHVFPAYVDEVVGELVRGDPPATCLIADTYSTWASAVARKYGLVQVSFWTQPALVLTLLYHLDLLKKNGHYGCVVNRQDTIDYVPGVDAIEPRDLMSHLQEHDTSKVMHKILHKAFEDVKKADFIICNTVKELEPETSAVLHERQTTYTIGPLFATGFTDREVNMNLWPESDCTEWLDSKAQGSVLYASFGSYAHTNKEDVREIANGLMLSGVDFIWVLRPGVSVCSEVGDLLPNGFEENVRGRALIVPWCDQPQVMKNPAVGGFLTHCGWNSILESIWCGLPMVCFPLVADQTTNRKLVVDDWKIGINLWDGDRLSSREVAEKIMFLMRGDDSRGLREAIGEFRKKLENALRPDGSSVLSFDDFVKDLRIKLECN